MILVDLVYEMTVNDMVYTYLICCVKAQFPIIPDVSGNQELTIGLPTGSHTESELTANIKYEDRYMSRWSIVLLIN
jgi:hypothetical protein